MKKSPAYIYIFGTPLFVSVSPQVYSGAVVDRDLRGRHLSAHSGNERGVTGVFIDRRWRPSAGSGNPYLLIRQYSAPNYREALALDASVKE
jgi:hypothetical protein